MTNIYDKLLAISISPIMFTNVNATCESIMKKETYGVEFFHPLLHFG